MAFFKAFSSASFLSSATGRFQVHVLVEVLLHDRLDESVVLLLVGLDFIVNLFLTRDFSDVVGLWERSMTFHRENRV